MFGAQTYHRSYGLERAVEELSVRAEVASKGAVDCTEVRMLA